MSATSPSLRTKAIYKYWLSVPEVSKNTTLPPTFLVPNDKLGMGKPVTVNFNINTVDATGFEELLVNSRGVLINLINSAVNEKGQRAII